MSGRSLALAISMLLALGTINITSRAPVATGRAVPEDGAAPGRPPSCEQSQLHPLDVSVRLLEALAPGRWITAEIVVHSAVDLDGLSLELSSVRDVALSGTKRVDLGPLPSGQEAHHTLQLRVGDTPEQRQFVVVVTGRAEGRTLRRGASLNLLPHGPHQPAVVSAASSKGRGVAEYPGAARRLP